MNVVAWILGIMLVVVFGGSGLTKLLDFDRMREHFGYSALQYRLIGLFELGGAGGVVAGLIWRKVEWLAVAAAVGLMTLLCGAMLAHARVDDPGTKVIPAVVMFTIALLFSIIVSLR